VSAPNEIQFDRFFYGISISAGNAKLLLLFHSECSISKHIGHHKTSGATLVNNILLKFKKKLLKKSVALFTEDVPRREGYSVALIEKFDEFP